MKVKKRNFFANKGKIARQEKRGERVTKKGGFFISIFSNGESRQNRPVLPTGKKKKKKRRI